jgi:hypothetical protein
MQNDDDRLMARILNADIDFLAEIGRLTLLFSRIEDGFVHDGFELLKLTRQKKSWVISGSGNFASE